MISKEQQKALDDDGIIPTSWCQGTNMDGYEFREWEDKMTELDPIIDAIEKRICNEWWIYYKNEEEKESKLKEYEDRVRIVFWFDN